MTAADDVPPAHRELLLRAYAAYNSQDIEGLLALVSDDVDWSDGEAGRLHGKAEVGAYWAKQWAGTRTHDEPTGFRQLSDGRTAVLISQVVRSVAGTTISQGRFLHRHRIHDGRITVMDIDPGEP